MSDTAKLVVDGADHDLPVVVGTEGDRAIDISKLRESTGHVTLDVRLHEHRFLPVGHHLRRRREGGPPLPRHTRGAACRAEHVLSRPAGCSSTVSCPPTSNSRPERPLHQVRDDSTRASTTISTASRLPVTQWPSSAMINAMSCYEPDLMLMESESTFQVGGAPHQQDPHYRRLHLRLPRHAIVQ